MKLTEKDIRYIITETANKLLEFAYDPRNMIPKVRGGWTEAKILKYLKEFGSLNGMTTAIRLIAEFDNVEELRSHIFYHGSKYAQSKLKPSITFHKNWDENDGGGGYGDRYWGISLSKSKRISSNFGGGNSRGVNVHPIVLAKNANVITGEGLTDAYDVAEHIVEYYTNGVDAVWIGENGGGENELLVINPRCICNMEAVQYFEYYQMREKYGDRLNNASDEQLQELLDTCKEWAEQHYRQPIKPHKPIRSEYFSIDNWKEPEKPKSRICYNSDEEYQDGMNAYQQKMDAYKQSQNNFNAALKSYDQQMEDYYNSDEYKQYLNRKNIMQQRMNNLE